MKENFKNQSVNAKMVESKVTNKPVKDREITPQYIAKFKKDAIDSMVKVLTSEDGYKVMKELSKR